MKKDIRVLFQSRYELFDTRGGDTYQMEHTKKAIEKLYPNYKITIDNSIKAKEIDSYDIVNLFNLDWICETYLQAKYAKENNKPLVLSAIHHPVDKIKLFEETYRFGIRRIVNSLVKSQHLRDVSKNIYRSIKFPQKAFPTLVQFVMGTRNQQAQVIKMRVNCQKRLVI